MAKILISPGYGAGWTTWLNGSKEFREWALTYPPFIKALENGEKLDENCYLAKQFAEDAKNFFNEEHVYFGGLDQLVVREVNGTFRINEYDGSESIVMLDVDGDYYTLP